MSSTTRAELVERVLRDALSLRDASLVMYRRGVLIEFKTEQLDPGLAITFEGRYRSWQVGPFEGHHCHLDLASIISVYFDAEPVSCQRGRLNYTIWFRCEGDCGNPYRPDGLFSVTLNSPYAADGTPRCDLIRAVYAIYDRHGDEQGVLSSDSFESARLEDR